MKIGIDITMKPTGTIFLLLDLNDSNFKQYYNYINKKYCESFHEIPIKFFFIYEQFKRHRFYPQIVRELKNCYFISKKELSNYGSSNSNLLFLDSNWTVIQSFGLSPDTFKDVNSYFDAIERYIYK